MLPCIADIPGFDDRQISTFFIKFNIMSCYIFSFIKMIVMMRNLTFGLCNP